MKKPLKVMVWCGLTVNGATKPYFLKEEETVNSLYYTRKILPHAKREGQRLLNTEKWVNKYISNKKKEIIQNSLNKNIGFSTRWRFTPYIQQDAEMV
jgi:hypothetical protein